MHFGAAILVVSYVVVAFVSHTRSHGAHDSNDLKTSDSVPPKTDDMSNRLHDPDVVQDEGHIQDHLNDETGLKVEDMTAEEMEFHYFRLHDTDNNTKLDGLEILAALSHMMPADDILSKKDDYTGKSEEEVKLLEEQRHSKVMNYYTSIIDQVLDEDDFDHDGYLTYMEYALARRRDERNYRKQKYRQKKHAKYSKHKQ